MTYVVALSTCMITSIYLMVRLKCWLTTKTDSARIEGYGQPAPLFLYQGVTTLSNITIDDVKAKLLTLDQVRERLAHTEPLATYDFDSEARVGFRLEPDFNH